MHAFTPIGEKLTHLLARCEEGSTSPLLFVSSPLRPEDANGRCDPGSHRHQARTYVPRLGSPDSDGYLDWTNYEKLADRYTTVNRLAVTDTSRLDVTECGGHLILDVIDVDGDNRISKDEVARLPASQSRGAVFGVTPSRDRLGLGNDAFRPCSLHGRASPSPCRTTSRLGATSSRNPGKQLIEL
ncbi:hypothetical protein OG365_01670 [Streptomyces sp. NBC_00853]|uniref:hypothetical protein n=1 Tax=Streptomyces sp. NBC_00853 TaxID=2903681 RepID=UPI003873038F|nr:hypothetical protein OG365_01670 [Streptomyces sp. NBC_00853]